MRRFLGLVAILCLALLAAGSRPSAAGLHFAAASGWTHARGSTLVIVATVPIVDKPGWWPQSTLRRLPPQGIVIVATRFPPSRGIPTRSLPLGLRDAEVRHGWEGQPAGNVAEYVLWQRVDGVFLDVRVYFGTQHPRRDVKARAQAELARLALS
jgi:hypothetical protein